MKIRIAGLEKESIVDGPGLRFVLFTQGCDNPCRTKGCHNPATHDPMGGEEVDTEAILSAIAQTKGIRGVTISGGEPFLQAAKVAHLIRRIRHQFPRYTIWTYTGKVFEDLAVRAMESKAIHDVITLSDVIVDGPFKPELRDISLQFRGSGNQRIIDVAQTYQQGKVVLWVDPDAVPLIA